MNRQLQPARLFVLNAFMLRTPKLLRVIYECEGALKQIRQQPEGVMHVTELQPTSGFTAAATHNVNVTVTRPTYTSFTSAQPHRKAEKGKAAST